MTLPQANVRLIQAESSTFQDRLPWWKALRIEPKASRLTVWSMFHWVYDGRPASGTDGSTSRIDDTIATALCRRKTMPGAQRTLLGHAFQPVSNRSLSFLYVQEHILTRCLSIHLATPRLMFRSWVIECSTQKAVRRHTAATRQHSQLVVDRFAFYGFLLDRWLMSSREKQHSTSICFELKYSGFGHFWT